jgi:hypothetical protein
MSASAAAFTESEHGAPRRWSVKPSWAHEGDGERRLPMLPSSWGGAQVVGGSVMGTVFDGRTGGLSGVSISGTTVMSGNQIVPSVATGRAPSLAVPPPRRALP